MQARASCALSARRTSRSVRRALPRSSCATQLQRLPPARRCRGEARGRRIDELRGLIERMGEINLDAIDEYDELEKRYTFSSTQKADLEKALAQLEKAIQQINATSKKPSTRPSTR